MMCFDFQTAVVTIVTMHCYVGVDVGGQSNTWAATITEDRGKIVRVQVGKTTLQAVVDKCQSEDVMALAIDAPLTFSMSRENGFRLSDDHLKKLLPMGFQARVMSPASMMAVPLRGTALATAASPFVGTIIETHPTACLLLAFTEGSVQEAVKGYKRSRRENEDKTDYDAALSAHCRFLWTRWTEHFQLPVELPAKMSGDPVDAVITATVAWLYHRAPERLQRLAPGQNDEVGRGPFWVVKQKSPADAPSS